MKMNDFQNRINLQRKILHLVNSKIQLDEPLISLSKSCIDRWFSNNRGIKQSTLDIIVSISEKTLFLATKSQEQITEEYSILSSDVSKKLNDLEKDINTNY
ncbi:hypothetical protein EA687_03280 [Acinetobacter baumannii]|nr:hypothetical protein AbaMCR54_10305 [Acinetobacter baumannii]PPC53480.1 hypothetical protein AbaHEU2_06925 [Acinetobacter baumannii]RSR04297.1 hypothetical protein EA687_03280 [Acinetobacter baumannii]